MAPPLETAPATDDASSGDTFELLKQQLELDISFCPRQIKGKTTFDIQPRKAQLSEIVFNARQLKPTHITIEGHKASFHYSNLHQRMTLYPGTDLGQYHFPKDRIQRHVNEGEDELVVHLPDSVKIRAVPPEEAGQAADAQGPFYAPLKIEITYVLDDFRDGLHFAGVEDGDSRFPHAYTRNSPFPGAASSLFPCIDDGETRCPFDVSIRYPRTMGDALSKHAPVTSATQAQTNGVDKADSVMSDADDDAGFSDEEKAMEMQVICSGVLTDDVRPGAPFAPSQLTMSRLLTPPTPPAKPPVSHASRSYSPNMSASLSAPSNTSTSPISVTSPTRSVSPKAQLRCTLSACLAGKRRSATVP